MWNHSGRVHCRSVKESIVILSYEGIIVYQHLLSRGVYKILPIPMTVQHRKSSTSSMLPVLPALLGAWYISGWAEAIDLPSGAGCKVLIVVFTTRDP